jgi:hypothetical protein
MRRLAVEGIDSSDYLVSRWEDYARSWQALGATHRCIDTMRAGYHSLDEHIAALRRVKEAFVIPSVTKSADGRTRSL